MAGAMPTDLHQHLLPEALIDALARRPARPRARPATGAGWRWSSRASRASALRPRRPRPRGARRDAERDGVDRVVVSLSTALGIEALPAAEAAPLLDAFNAASSSSAARSSCGAPRRPPATSTRCSTRARAASRSRRARSRARSTGASAPLLDRLEARDAPLFVHPGPGRRRRRRARLVAGADGLRRADERGLARVRRLGPRPPPAPARGVRDARRPRPAARRAARRRAAARRRPIHDPLVWFDSSSYGARTLDSMLRMVGVDRLVHGSDRPVIAAPGPRASATRWSTH